MLSRDRLPRTGALVVDMLLQRTAVHHCSTPHHTTVHIPHTHFLQLPSGGGVEGVMGPRPLAIFGTDNNGSAYGCV